MTSEVSSKIAKFAHDYRSKLMQEQGKTAAKMTKYDVALFMKQNGALSEAEFNSWVKEKEGQKALQLTTQQKDALKRGSIISFVQGMTSYLDSDEVSDFTLGNVMGFEKTTNDKTLVTSTKSKAVSKKKFSVAEELKKESFYNYIKSLPTPQATYTELMRSIEFEKLDNMGKMEMMLKISGEKFNEAKEKGDKQAMKDYLLEGIGMALQLSCQKIDSTVGITQFKEWAKERSGLNFLVDLVDKYVDDGDNATLSWMEKNWEGVKGFGDALDSFIGTQAIAFIGALELAGAAAGTGAIGQVFNLATKGYFLYDGGKMMAEGAVGYYNAETKQDARAAGQEFGMGSVIFAGTLKSVIGEIKAYRASRTAAPEAQTTLPELSEGHKAIIEQNMIAEKDLTQVKTDLAFLQENGIEIVQFNPGHPIDHIESSFIIKYNGKTFDVTNDIYEPYHFESAISQFAKHIKGEAPEFWSEVDAGVKPISAEPQMQVNEVQTVPKTAEGTTVRTQQLNEKTQQAIKDGLIRQEYIKDVEHAIVNSDVQNLVRNTMHRARTQSELQYFADRFKGSESTNNRYLALKAEGYKDLLPEKPNADNLSSASGNRILPEGKAAPSAKTESAIKVPEGTTVEEAKAQIAKLQKELKTYGAGTDRYDQIHMDRIQKQIKAYREIAPLDRTNLEEVLQASPDEIFQPVKADNIKGQGITFKPYVPEDPEGLAKVTYRAVPLFTKARTVEEMIRIAQRDGIKIELIQDENGNYYPGVKSVWSEGAYFKLDRDSYVVKYGEIPADDPYVDQAWAQQNKYINAEGKEVIMDCAIVAADKTTAADIMPHSYIKSNGANLSASDKTNWNGFDAHKDPNGIVNAVAYDAPKELQTLEGKITTDVTMGDVEGNVYNKFKDLKKQITKDKLVANPEDPNSQAFIDLIKAGKDEEAIALLRQTTKASSGENPTSTQLSSAEADMRTNQISYERGTNAQGNTEIRVKTSSIGIAGMEKATFDVYEYDAKGSLVSTKKDVSSKGLEKLNDVQTIDNSTGGQANMSIFPGFTPKGAKAKVQTNETAPKNRAEILERAGFTEEVIVDLKAKSDFYGPELVDEVLNMVVYLDGELANGAKLNRSLIESTIDRFSSGASGGSSATQVSILANYWSQGSKVYNAFGEKAPGQSTFSRGNLKAKWNKAKNAVKEFYEYKKFDMGIESSPSKEEAYTKAKTELYSQWETEKLVNEFNARFNYGVKEDLSILRAELTERGLAPNEHGFYVMQEGSVKPVASVGEMKTAIKAGNGVSEEFTAEFDKAKSTQDLEKMVKMAKTPEECQYIIDKLNNSTTKAVNDSAIEDIIEYAKFRAQGMRVDNYIKIKNSVAECKIPSDMPQTKGQIGNVTVTVAGGDMTAIKADAYVVPEFINCASEGGVGGAIARRGAAGGLKAYDEYVHVNGELDWGDVMVTESGGGKSSRLIHAATAGANAENSFETVQKAVYNSLKAAEKEGMQSVVVPAMGTGIIGHLTDVQSSQAIMAGINQFAAEGGKMDVSVVVYSKGKGYTDFTNTLTSKSYESAKPAAGTKEFDAGAWAGEFAQTLHEAPVASSKAKPAKVVSTPDKSPEKDTTITSIKAGNAADVSPMEADTGIKPLGKIGKDEAMPQIQKYAEENGLSVSYREGLFGDTYDLTNVQGQKVRTVVFDRESQKVDIEWNRTFDSRGKKINETMYNADGIVDETTDFKYDSNGNLIASIKLKEGYDEVGVFEYDSKGQLKADYYTTVEQAEAKFGKLSHTEILK